MKFEEFLASKKLIIIDGAMGTELAKRGLEMSGTNNLTNPEAVLAVHRDYVKAGANAIITNTLTMNRISLESHGAEVDLCGVNMAGARLAREAAGAERLVFGDMSSTGQLLEPYGDYTEEQFINTFKEQASFLAEGGVDGFIIETMIDLREAVCALKACKVATNLPVIMSLSFTTTSNGGRTVMGNTLAEIAKAAEDYGAAAVGSNCGELDPLEMAEIVKMFKGVTSLPIIIEPNAGKPVLVDEQAVFKMGPEEFAAGVKKCLENGAKLIGGCCGTSPAHIQKVSEIIKVIEN